MSDKFLKLREKPQILEHPVTNGPHDFNDLIDAVDLPLAVWIFVSALRPISKLYIPSIIKTEMNLLVLGRLGLLGSSTEIFCNFAKVS